MSQNATEYLTSQFTSVVNKLLNPFLLDELKTLFEDMQEIRNMEGDEPDFKTVDLRNQLS